MTESELAAGLRTAGWHEDTVEAVDRLVVEFSRRIAEINRAGGDPTQEVTRLCEAVSDTLSADPGFTRKPAGHA